MGWDVEYRGYSRPDDDAPDAPTGFIEFHIAMELYEAFVSARDQKTYKWVKRPGYKLVVYQSDLLPGGEWESYQVLAEEFTKDRFPAAVDAFMREVLNSQSWICIGESRASLIPHNKAAFECPLCGWATDSKDDDITCMGCGKRFWSSKLFRGDNNRERN